MKIEFKVRGQTLIRADNRSVAGNSYGFLRAGFDFGDDWAGLIKVACFTTSGGSAYDVTLGTGQTCECEVANEALAASATQGGFFYVSVRGVDAVSDATVRGTVNRVRVDLEASGAMQGVNSVPATPSETEQILAYLAKGTWLDGVAVSGTGTGIEVTGVDGAAVGAHYFNTFSGHVYKCTAVNGVTSTWRFLINLKGDGGGGGGDQPTIYITPEMCGAPCDGVNPDTAAFQTALDLSAESGLPVVANLNYIIDTPLHVHNDLYINGMIYYDGGTAEYETTHDKACLIIHKVVGDLVYEQFVSNHFKIRVTNRSTTAPLDKTTGVKIYNCKGCTIELDYIENFYIGAELEGRGRSFWTTQVSIGVITNFRYGLVLSESRWDVENKSDRTGAFNQCVFFGGHFFCDNDNSYPATTFQRHLATGIFLSSSITSKTCVIEAVSGQTSFDITYDDSHDFARISKIDKITVTPYGGEPVVIPAQSYSYSRATYEDNPIKYTVTIDDVSINAGDTVTVYYETESSNRKSNNIFISPCTEYLGTGIEVAYGSGNWFYGIRGEGVQFAVRCTRYATENYFFVGFDPAHYECDDTTSSNVIASPEDYVGKEYAFDLTKDDVIANLLSVNEASGALTSVEVDGFYNCDFTESRAGSAVYDMVNFDLTEDGRGIVSKIPSQDDDNIDPDVRPYIGLFVDTSENKDVKIDFVGTQPQNYYRKVNSQPDDWSTNYNQYYTLTGEKLIFISKIKYSVPYSPNTFYDLVDDQYVYVTSEAAPADWVEGEDGYVAGNYRGRNTRTELFNINTYYRKENGAFVVVNERPNDWSENYVNYYKVVATPISGAAVPEFGAVDGGVYELVRNGWTPFVIEYVVDGVRIDDNAARPQHKLYGTNMFKGTYEHDVDKKYLVEHTFFGFDQGHTKVAFATSNEIEGNKFMLRVPDECKKAFVGLIAFWEGAELEYIKVSTLQPNKQIIKPNRLEDVRVSLDGIDYTVKVKRINGGVE